MENKTHIPEQTARKIEEIKEHQKNFGEKTLEEMLFIFEDQRYISSPQGICFREIYQHYNGNKKQEYLERYNKVKSGDCYGI